MHTTVSLLQIPVVLFWPQGGDRVPADSFRCPAHRFAAIPHAVNQLLESLSSTSPNLVAAALGALANLSNVDDLREHLRLDARVSHHLPPRTCAHVHTIMNTHTVWTLRSSCSPRPMFALG